ncbi:GNAT family N-acetyltransferase [Leucobacter sp. BZR 635]
MTFAPIRTERLELRLLTDADREWLVSVYSQPEVGRFIPAGPWTADISEAEISKRMNRRGFDTEQGAVSLMVLHEGERVAEVMCWFTDRDHRVAEIGWAGDPAHAGQGFVTEAATALLDYVFSEVRMHRVAAIIDPRNVPSMRVAERIGMRLEGHLREAEWMRGEWCDTLIYGKLASDQNV